MKYKWGIPYVIQDKVRMIKTRVIPIRLTPPQMSIIERAYTLIGQNRAEFVRESAMRRAEEILSGEFNQGSKQEQESVTD